MMNEPTIAAPIAARLLLPLLVAVCAAARAGGKELRMRSDGVFGEVGKEVVTLKAWTIRILRWFFYLPKLQMRFAIRVLEKHGLFRFFLCGALFIGCCLVAVSPVALINEFGFGRDKPAGLLAISMFLYVMVVWLQAMIPWAMIQGIILERLNIGLRYGHKPNSRLDRARTWANDQVRLIR
jgi:hypothetical protein